MGEWFVLNSSERRNCACYSAWFGIWVTYNREIRLVVMGRSDSEDTKCCFLIGYRGDRVVAEEGGVNLV